ncbi:MAG TPA: ABC transporter permease, partial [Pyrinomonadaceae bacterium]|nr:ABC transporter permease [Pyrinomonadaceae bacterium]
TALLNGIEHSDRQWKHIFALPVARYSIYFAKVIVAQTLILISTFILAGLIVVVGWAAMYLRPELANSGAAPYGSLAKNGAFVWLASWLIIAIHTWISMRWSGFPISLGAGIGGTFFALFAASAAIGKYYPWLLPMNIFLEGRFTSAIVIGVVGGIVAMIVGCFEFVRRDVLS